MSPERVVRVLIVDDDPEVSDLVREILRDRLQIMNISVCNNGSMGLWELERAATAGRPFHLVISDWNMPTMTGLELLKLTRANPKTAKTPFVLLTARNEKDNVIEAAKTGVTAYVTKPLSEDVLVTKVKGLLAI